MGEVHENVLDDDLLTIRRQANVVTFNVISVQKDWSIVQKSENATYSLVAMIQDQTVYFADHSKGGGRLIRNLRGESIETVQRLSQEIAQHCADKKLSAENANFLILYLDEVLVEKLSESARSQMIV